MIALMTAGIGQCAALGCNEDGVVRKKSKSSREQSKTVPLDSKSTCEESTGTGGGGRPGSTKAETGFDEA